MESQIICEHLSVSDIIAVRMTDIQVIGGESVQLKKHYYINKTFK